MHPVFARYAIRRIPGCSNKKALHCSCFVNKWKKRPASLYWMTCYPQPPLLTLGVANKPAHPCPDIYHPLTHRPNQPRGAQAGGRKLLNVQSSGTISNWSSLVSSFFFIPSLIIIFGSYPLEFNFELRKMIVFCRKRMKIGLRGNKSKFLKKIAVGWVFKIFIWIFDLI